MVRGNRLVSPILLGLVLLAWSAVETRADTVWTEPVKKSLSISATDLRALHVSTHNGSITFTGDPNKPPAVTVTLKGGGKSKAEAAKALAAIELLAPTPDSGEALLGWRWKSATKPQYWRAMVSFDIVAPPTLDLSAQTHNGPVRVARVDGSVEVETHNGKIGVSEASGDVEAVAYNGRIKIRATGKKLICKTHNGRIDVRFTGSSMELGTHNGVVVANVSGATTIGGVISTHNGAIELRVGVETATNLDCTTHRGAMHCDAPISEMEQSKGKLTGKLGSGGAVLAVKTNSGSIDVLVAD